MGLPESLRIQLQDVYAQERTRGLGEIRAAAAELDRVRIERATHRLHPSAVQMGEDDLAAQLASLNEWARSKRAWDEARPILRAVASRA